MYIIDINESKAVKAFSFPNWRIVVYYAEVRSYIGCNYMHKYSFSSAV